MAFRGERWDPSDGRRGLRAPRLRFEHGRRGALRAAFACEENGVRADSKDRASGNMPTVS